MARVVVIPGVCGSSIQVDRYYATVPYWCHPPLLVAQGPFALWVNDAGTGDRPEIGIRRTIVNGILTSYYGRLVTHFRSLGHDVYAAGYDWRLGVQQVSTELYGRLKLWAGDDPFFIVAHSLGGLVGRGVIRRATDAGQGAQIVRLLTLGSPHRGSLSIPRLWMRLGTFYPYLVLAFYPGLAVYNAIHTAGGPLNVLDEIVGSLVSTFALLPQPGSPVFGGGYDYSASVDRGTYSRWNAFLTDQRFSMAVDEHAFLQGSVYPAQQLSVIGLGLPTAYQVKDVNRLNEDAGYWYDNAGDGTVDVGSATLAGVRSVNVSGVEHQALPYDPTVLPRLPGLLLTGQG